MKKSWLFIVVLLVVSGLFVIVEEVWVYNWFDYIDEELLVKFEVEIGYDLIYDVFDLNEVLEIKMLVGGLGYDVVVLIGLFFQCQIIVGVFQLLDMFKLLNLENLWDVIVDCIVQYDFGNVYLINYMWGIIGFGINVGMVIELLGEDVLIDSFVLIFDLVNMEKLVECGVYILDVLIEVILVVLVYLGEDLNFKDLEVIVKVEEVLVLVCLYIQKFYSLEYINVLVNGEICVVFGWLGDVFQVCDCVWEVDNGIEIVYYVFVEGVLMWFD